MKLLDVLRRDGFAVNSRHGGFAHASANTLFSADAVVVDITNVAEYFALSEREVWRYADFPNIAPPWPRAFFEFSFPRRWSHGGDIGVVAGLRFGTLIESSPQSGGGWACHAHVFAAPPRGSPNPTLLIGSVAFPVRADGLADVTVGRPGLMYPLSDGEYPDTRAFTDMIDNWLKPTFLALSFLHCRNVSIIEHATPPRVAAKRAKAGKPIGVTYKTLVIDGMTNTLRTEGGIAQHGLKRALHICRGHFATYTAERPLFGRVTGTVWKPMHTRGSKGRGEVKKDYRVDAPTHEDPTDA
jgi:hypothetical protein